MAAVAYIRRSASGEAQASEQLQRETIARLAAERGDAIEAVYKDWGKSGGSDTRPEYLKMLAHIEADHVHAVYAYDSDRLARDIWLLSGLMRLAKQRSVRIYTSAGELTDDDTRTLHLMRGVMDDGELVKITKRNQAVKRLRRERGDDPGTVAFGYRKVRAQGGELNRKGQPVQPGAVIDVLDDAGAIERVLAAYREAGTYLGAARALTAAGVPPPFAGRARVDGQPYGNGRYAGGAWLAPSVRRIVLREAPELAPTIKGVSRRHRARNLMKLLRCHCGQTMTPGGGARVPAYWCTRGQTVPGHGNPWSVAESKLLPWIKAEAARLRVPGDVLESDGPAFDDSADRAALDGMRTAIGEDAYALAVASLDRKRAERGERQRLVEEIPQAVDWTWPPETINNVLRTMFEVIELGPDLLPVKAVWNVPEWRA